MKENLTLLGTAFAAGVAAAALFVYMHSGVGARMPTGSGGGVVPDPRSVEPSTSSSAAERPKSKFAPRNGITFYYFPRSPCARRVWVTLLAKKIKVEMVLVDLIKGEQRNPEFLAINPQGKVPAIRCHNCPNIPDCILYESQAIVEWLDEQFPDSFPSLYPSPRQFLDRLEVKLWQYWELSMAEDMWPLSRQQVDGVIWRFTYSKRQFYESGPPRETSSDPFYSHKVKKVYEGTYLTKADARRRALRVLRAFQMLELALGDRKFKLHGGDGGGGGGCTYLVGSSFSQADVACYPRLCKVPQNGLVSTEVERAMFPNVCEYFAALRSNGVFKQFAVVDEAIWLSGEYPLFLPNWWGRFLPWWLVVAVGNWRAGLQSFSRVTQASLGEEAVHRHLALVSASPLAAIPSAPIFSHTGDALFRRERAGTFVFSDDSESIVDLSSNFGGSDGHRESESEDGDHHGAIVTIYHHPAFPLSVATRVCLQLQSHVASVLEGTRRSAAAEQQQQQHQQRQMVVRNTLIDVTRLEHLSPEFLRLMPMGEVPVLVHGHRVVYGPHIIVEYMDEVLFGGAFRSRDSRDSTPSSSANAQGTKSVSWAMNAEPSSAFESSCRLLPSMPIDRAVVRRWFGWARTAYFYQIEPLFNARVLPRRVRENGFGDAAALFEMAAQQGVTPEDAEVVAEKCYGTFAGETASMKNDHGKEEEEKALVLELLSRIDTVESELKITSMENRGRSLLGHVHFTYADYFVLSIVLLAEVYSALPLNPAKHPFVCSWKQALLQDSRVSILFLDMIRFHGFTD